MNMLMLQSTAVLGRMMHKVLVHIQKYLNADTIAYLCYYAHMNVCMSYVDMSLKRIFIFLSKFEKSSSTTMLDTYMGFGIRTKV